MKPTYCLPRLSLHLYMFKKFNYTTCGIRCIIIIMYLIFCGLLFRKKKILNILNDSQKNLCPVLFANEKTSFSVSARGAERYILYLITYVLIFKTGVRPRMEGSKNPLAAAVVRQNCGPRDYMEQHSDGSSKTDVPIFFIWRDAPVEIHLVHFGFFYNQRPL